MSPSAEQSSTSWADFNLDASTISMECGKFQVVVALDNVEQVHVSCQMGFLKATFLLSTCLQLEEEEVSKVQVVFLDNSKAVTILQQMFGDRLKVKERRARGSRSAPVKVVDDVVEASTSNHQQVSKRKSSSSGVVCVSLAESFAAAEEEELEKERSQPIISNTSNTTQDSGADVLSKNTRAKEMANRRRELEQSVAREPINIRQRSEDRKHKSTKKEIKEVGEKKKRRKSSKTVAEVKCRKETATELPAQEVNDRGKNSQLEDEATGGKGPVIDPGQGECEEEVEWEEVVHHSRAKEMGKSNNHGEDTPTSAQAGCCENH